MCSNSYHQTFKEGQMCRFCHARCMAPFLLESASPTPVYLVFAISKTDYEKEEELEFTYLQTFFSIEDAIIYASSKYNNQYIIGDRDMVEKNIGVLSPMNVLIEPTLPQKIMI